ncbi:aminocarboxymuconate-semialdehyde decarboxylase [Paraburkholderia sp. GAS199]|uniref:amidohydrolase family protein n=1 Tax=Paraburkholderia sp. GAS199 TaxID=3035126 RepID=UPI003D22CF3A
MLYTCSPGCRDPRHGHSASDGARTHPGNFTVDVHCHRLDVSVAKKAAALDPAAHDPSTIFANQLTRDTNVRQMSERAPQLTDVNRRLADMDRMGIDVQVVSPAPFQYHYFAPAKTCASLAREINEGMQELVNGHPDRFAALGTVPLQDSPLAVDELTHAMSVLGLRGVEIGPNVNGKNLTDPSLGLEPFFARANELEAVIFLHPVGYSDGARLTEHYFNNVIGNPLETTVAASHLIFDGVVARYPRIKFLLAHGGGYVAHYWARMDHAWHARPDCRGSIDRPPSEWLRKMYFDSVVFDPVLLGHLISKYGAKHVLLGSDYPYDMGDDDPVGLVAAVENLSAEERAQILGGTASELFKLNAPVAGNRVPTRDSESMTDSGADRQR